ncbi:MAG: outer membrane beta-barrel domain-containing protein [Bdellovibrio sp.]
MKWKTDSMISKANKLIFLVTVFLSLSGNAAVIEFAEDEIPSESVVPVLDSNLAVKNKLIQLKGRGEIGLLGGTVIDEMFYNNTIYGVQFYYNVDSENAFGVKYLDRSKGLSEYSDQFKNSQKHLDFNKAPAPGSILAATYRWSFLYGKISLSKNIVIPTVFSTETDLGINKDGQQNLPYGSLGITHKVYIKQNWGIGVSYRILVYQILNPVSANIGSSGPALSESDFSKKIQISQSIDLALSYLF